jgi:hypothetical protein
MVDSAQEKEDVEEYYTNMCRKNKLREEVIKAGKKVLVTKTYEEWSRIEKIKEKNHVRLIKLIKPKFDTIVKKNFTQDLIVWREVSKNKLVGGHRPTPITPNVWYGKCAADFIRECDKNYPIE